MQAQQTRELIVSNCRDIIHEQGLQGLLMDEVARRCGISKKTIYGVFGSKETLMEFLGATFFREAREEFLNGIQHPLPLWEKLQFIICHLIKLSELIPYEELEFLKKKHKTNYQMLLQHLSEIAATLEELLADGQSAGAVYPDLEVSTQAKLLFAQLQYLHMNHRQLMAIHSAAHWHRHIANTFFRSTMAEPLACS